MKDSTWNWQQKNWPEFTYDKSILQDYEAKFLSQSGLAIGTFKHLPEEDRSSLIVEFLSNEALKTSEIEGELLNRASLQSSIKRNFGLTLDNDRSTLAEQGVSELMVDLYRNYNDRLSEKLLNDWHLKLMKGREDKLHVGEYRSHESAMQVVSGNLSSPKVHFEAPPSKKVKEEMKRFVKWFNETSPTGKTPLSALVRAGIAHLYFISIHPYEDGNGRIARALCEKSLSQCLGHPALINLSQEIMDKRKDYYLKLELNNKSLRIDSWLNYFCKSVLRAQEKSLEQVVFLINKTKFFSENKNEINLRQEKVLLRMFKEGVEGFKGGLSAENYISITKTSRSTATRDLDELVKKGILLKTGERKGTRYELKLK